MDGGRDGKGGTERNETGREGSGRDGGWVMGGNGGALRNTQWGGTGRETGRDGGGVMGGAIVGLFTVPAQCPHSARTVPAQCPHSARCKNTHNRACDRNVQLEPMGHSYRMLDYVCFYSGHCAGTVRALCGHCAGTVRALCGHAQEALLCVSSRPPTPTMAPPPMWFMGESKERLF